MSVKTDVLNALASSESPVSGGELAHELGVSRNAIWKAVRSLCEEGYEVESCRKGYLLKEKDVLCEAGLKSALAKYGVDGYTMRVYDETDSTNRRAKELASSGSDVNLVIADRQSAGRGRMEHSFFSPPGVGIYMSVVVRGGFSLSDAPKITGFAAVAVARALSSGYGVEVGIKWVNDIFLHGKKICGILTEAVSDLETGIPEYVVIGIGINARKTEFPPELAYIAGSIENECGVKIDRCELTALILRELADLPNAVTMGSHIDEYRRRSIVIGREVTVVSATETYAAKAKDIAPDGTLVVVRDGAEENLSSGEVRIKL